MFVIILFLVIVYKNKLLLIFKERIIVFLCLLGIYFFFVNFWVVLFEIYEYDVSNFIKVFLVIVVLIKLVNIWNDFNIVIWLYIVGSVYIGFYILEIGCISYGRVEGIGVVDVLDVNGFVVLLVIGIVFCLYYFWVKKGFVKFVVIIVGVLIVNVLVLMNSRGVFLGVFIGVGWFVFYFYCLKV